MILSEKAKPACQQTAGLRESENRAVLLAGRIENGQYSDAIRQDVQQLLDDPDLLFEFKGELIRALIRARVSARFHTEKDGLSIEFDPSLLTDPDRDPVVQKTRELIKAQLAPSALISSRFVCSLLDQEVLETLPFDLGGYDPQTLAGSIVRLVCREMKDEDGWKAYSSKYLRSDFKPYTLRVEKRGNTL